MKMIKSIAVAALATAVSGEDVRALTEPHVQYYAHQWDLINDPLFHALFSSTYLAEASAEMFKANADSGRFNLGFRLAARLWWEINLGMNFFDFFWVIVQSRATLLDAHPLKIQMTVPDYVDQFSTAMNEYKQTCAGLEVDTSVLNVATTISINFKKMNLSLLDVFNYKAEYKTQDIDSASV